MPGERIGYVCIPDSVTDSAKLHAAVAGASRAFGHVCAPSMMQRVIARATGLRPDLEAYDKNRHTLYNALTTAKENKVVDAGDIVVLTAGDPQTSPRQGDYTTSTNLAMIAQVQ